MERWKRAGLSLLCLAAATWGSTAWSVPAVTVKEGRIPVEAFTGGPRYVMEGKHGEMPFRIFLPPEAFTSGGIFHPSSYAQLPEDASVSITTSYHRYYYVNDEGTSPSWVYESGLAMMFFYDLSLRDMVLRSNMEYKVLGDQHPGFPLVRVEVYPEPHKVNSTRPLPGTPFQSGSAPSPIDLSPPVLTPTLPGEGSRGDADRGSSNGESRGDQGSSDLNSRSEPAGSGGDGSLARGADVASGCSLIPSLPLADAPPRTPTVWTLLQMGVPRNFLSFS